MPATKDEAIVLRRLDYSETSQVILVLTREHGPRRLIAKGVKRSTKKQFAAGIDLLEWGHVVFLSGTRPGSGLGTLTEWRQKESLMGLRSDLARLYGAEYAAEITAAMIEEADPHPAVFDALGHTLTVLAGDREVMPTLVEYQCALLDAVGLWPDLTRCVICDKAAPPNRAAYFSAISGGLICRECRTTARETRIISAALLTSVRKRDIRKETAREAFELMNYTISHSIGRQPMLTGLLLAATPGQ